jgi:uncharacterized membrane protein
MRYKKMIITALFIALSYVGANIKIFSSIAFDSVPGFLAALLLGPFYGAIIGAAGHFLTAVTSGFPQSILVHSIIMFYMALTMWVFGKSYCLVKRRSKILAAVISVIAAIIINGPVAVISIIPLAGKGILAYLPVLCMVAGINSVFGIVLYEALPERIKKWK